MKTALVICPHADDAAAFCGGTVAKRAAEGWKVVLARVTNDAKDSVGLSVEETIRTNTAELHEACAIMGVSEIEELGYETDAMGDVPLTQLRERMVYLFRKHRPYAVFSFDPFGLYEENQDHLRTAYAVDEAFWVSAYDKHYPEHFEEGIEPFAVCERWYYARRLQEPNHAEDVTDHMDTRIRALCAHRAMMRNTVHRFRMQCETWGRRVPLFDAALDGNLEELLGLVLREQGKAVAEQFGLPPGRMAEAFRLYRFGDLDPLVEQLSEPRDTAG